MLKNKKAVIFDLDGSLVDSMWVWLQVDELYMEKYHLTPSPSFHKDIEGMGFTETAQYFLHTFPSLSCTLEEVCQEWMDISYELYRTKVALKSGAFEFLQEMKRRGIRLGIATSNTRKLVETVLEVHNVRDYFTAIATSCEVQAGKPAPDVYLKVAKELQVEPEKCLVFEDVPNGILAGKNAGMTVCAVQDEFSRPDEAEKRRLADYFIRDYFDIKNETYESCGA